MKSTLSLTFVLAALVLAGCGSGAVPSPSSPGERSAPSTVELFAKDIQYTGCSTRVGGYWVLGRAPP